MKGQIKLFFTACPAGRISLDYIRASGYINAVCARRVDVREAAAHFKVLADEARLSIIWLLFNHEELCVCDLMEVLGITQSKTSRHLRILYHAGLVTDRREGLWRYYALRPLRDGSFRNQIEALRATLAARPDATRLLRKLSAVVRKREEGHRCCER